MYLLKNSILSFDQGHFVEASTWILFWMKLVGSKTVVLIKTANWTVKGKDIYSNLDSIPSVEWWTSGHADNVFTYADLKGLLTFVHPLCFCLIVKYVHKVRAVITLCLKSCMSSHGAQWKAQEHCLNWGHQNCVSVLFVCFFVQMTWFSSDHCDWPWIIWIL